VFTTKTNNMKRLFYAVLCTVAGMMTACSDDQQNPDSRVKDKLGLVMLEAGSNSRVLLLESGEVANPVSGIEDFHERSIGSKLLLDYKLISTDDGISNIAVTRVENAEDSTFIIDPDSSEFEPGTIFSNSFSGSFYTTNHDSTEVFSGEATFSFGTETQGTTTFECTVHPDNDQAISGSGLVTIGNGVLIFSSQENILVPSGEYFYSLYNDWLYFWRVDEGTGDFKSYALRLDD
jgi:hypothetical protein